MYVLLNCPFPVPSTWHVVNNSFFGSLNEAFKMVFLKYCLPVETGSIMVGCQSPCLCYRQKLGSTAGLFLTDPQFRDKPWIKSLCKNCRHLWNPLRAVIWEKSILFAYSIQCIMYAIQILMVQLIFGFYQSPGNCTSLV